MKIALHVSVNISAHNQTVVHSLEPFLKMMYVGINCASQADTRGKLQQLSLNASSCI